MKAEIDAIFIDDGGVMNDNVPRGAEWRRLVGEFFSGELGGEKEAWSEANRIVIADLWPMIVAGPEDREYEDWLREYQVKWLRGMAQVAGRPAPREDGECIRLAWQASEYVTPRVRSAFPGAAEAVRTLDRMGFALFTASGEHSRELEGYMTGMGIREGFSILYGPDIVSQGKYTPEYYRRLFKHSGVDPRKALVVDDGAQYLQWAKGLGATTCLVGSPPPATGGVDLSVPSLASVPAALNVFLSSTD